MSVCSGDREPNPGLEVTMRPALRLSFMMAAVVAVVRVRFYVRVQMTKS